MDDTGVPPQAGSGHSPKGGAAISVPSPAKPSVPNAAMIATTIVLEHSDRAAQAAFGRELFERYPFDPALPTRMTGLSYSQDALSTINFISEALEDDELDAYDTTACIEALIECHGAYDKLRAVAAEWSLASAIEARSGETVKLGSTEGESAVPERQTPNPSQDTSPSSKDET